MWGSSSASPAHRLASLLDPAPLAATLQRVIPFPKSRPTSSRRHDRRGGRGHHIRATSRTVVFHRGGGEPGRGREARDRLRRDRAARRARARIGGDPGGVSRRRGVRATRGPRLVLRRWHAAEHPDQARPRAGGRAGRGARAQLDRPRRSAAGLPAAARRAGGRGAARAGGARRPARQRRGHAGGRQPDRRAVAARPSCRRPCATSAWSPTSSSPPQRRDTVGRLARDIFNSHYAGARGLLRSPDVRLLGTSGGRRSATPPTASCSATCSSRASSPRALLELGRRDAQRWLDARHSQGLWQVGPLWSGG